jgi:hypothetical protein
LELTNLYVLKPKIHSKIQSNIYVLIYEMKIIIYFNKPSISFFFFLFIKPYLLETKAHTQKETSKATCIFNNLLETYFYKLEFENECTLV